MKAFFVITIFKRKKKKKKRRRNHLHSTQSAVFQLAREQSGKHFCKNISYSKATECEKRTKINIFANAHSINAIFVRVFSNVDTDTNTNSKYVVRTHVI